LCHRRFNSRIKPPYARHCFIRFDENDNDTMSFDLDGVHPDPDPDQPGRQCRPAGPDDRDACIKREMKNCKKYDFFGFNCCHCAEQALKACGIRLPDDAWPNWPINPGPQPGEPDYSPYPVFP